MLLNWINILNNWVNCYLNDSVEKYSSVSLESLLNIISHLHSNLSLDESKSSSLEAHTLEEFIVEKYPEFTFRNGTIELSTEEDLYAAASLLLYFICVNSKDMDLKNAMCNKLKPEDQEIIMKFSKTLLECSAVTYKELENAILEASGQDVAIAQETGSQNTVSETPKALRSLHVEVRRLQAALDAERFDRNYLQEEHKRNTIKIENLLKEKEQQKQDILNLKTQILDCSCQEKKTSIQGDADNSAKLLRQLNDMEQRLVDTQAQLYDVIYERDTYKTKVDELKLERDKCLAFGQQEATTAAQLSEQLDQERNNVESLRELVSELRQHLRHNRLDASQLECDDLDISIQSFGNNQSICNEACANVVEVQLGEERAKGLELSKQMHMLQDQLCELTKKAEEERLSFEKIILDLKHKVNEAIEEKNKYKSHYSNEISQLSNEINELEQKIRNNNDAYSRTIELKLKDIQTLQEEKLSLLQSLNDETSKYQKMIKDVKEEMNLEKVSKIKLKEDYDNYIMKLNEKVLNRNNELVELQDNLCKKSEMIESLHLDLRREKENFQQVKRMLESEIRQQKHDAEVSLKSKTEEVLVLQKKLDDEITSIECLKNEMGILRDYNNSLENEVKTLEETKQNMTVQINVRDQNLEELKKEIENLKNVLSEEKEAGKHLQDDMTIAVSTLQEKLQAETMLKSDLQHRINQLNDARDSLAKEVNRLTTDLQNINEDMVEKEQIINSMDLYLKEEKHTTSKMNEECNLLRTTIEKMSQDVIKKDNMLKSLKEELEICKNEIQKKDSEIKRLNDDLVSHVSNINKLNNEITAKCAEILLLKEESVKLSFIVEDSKKELKNTELKLQEELKLLKDMKSQKDNEIKGLNQLIIDLKKELKELKEETESEKQWYIQAFEALKKENEQLLYTIEKDTSNHKLLIQEKDTIILGLEQQLKDISLQLTSLRKDHDVQTCTLEKLKKEMINEIECKENEMAELQENLQLSKRLLKQNTIEAEITEAKLNLEMDNLRKKYDALLLQLKTENASLQETFSHELGKFYEVVHEKDVLLDEINQQKETIEKLGRDNQKLHAKCNQLNNEILTQKVTLEDRLKAIDDLIFEKDCLNKELLKVKEALKNTLEENKKIIIEKEQQSLKQTEESAAKNLLIEEKEILTQQLVEEKSARDLIQNEKQILLKEKNKVICEIKVLEEQLAKEIILKENLEENNTALISNIDNVTQKLTAEICAHEKLQKEKENLVSLNQTLIEKLSNEKTKHEILSQEKDILMVEKESLVKTLSKEKAYKDELETEKKAQEEKLKDLNQRQSYLITVKSEEVKKIEEELKGLKHSYDENVNLVHRTMSTLQLGIEKLLQTLRKEDIQNELLQKLINVDQYVSMPINEQCDLLVNIADTLTTELSIRKSLEKALEHENTAMSEMKELFKQKEMKLHELKMDLKRVQQSLKESKTELSKYQESYNNTIEEKSRVIQQLQQENQALYNEINDLKLQLEIKVHSLNEKLIDNELLTDKLKKTYECQIDNLNLMSNKLTNYLKDKTVELEGMRKEKEKLKQIIEDNNKAINSLEEEVKSQKLNQEKLITDFESERLILKNMVTVTESVMEDQKYSLEKVISDHVKSYQNIQAENEKLKLSIEREKLNFNSRIKEKDSAFEMLFKELSEERSNNKTVQQELENRVTELKLDIESKIVQKNNLEQQNKVLEESIRKSQTEIAQCNAKCDHLSAKQEELARIITNKDTELETMTETIMLLKLEIEHKNQEFQILMQTNKDYEQKYATINKEISDIKNAKFKLEQENKDFIQKIDVLTCMVEEMSKEKEETNKMRKINEENKTVIANLEQLIKHELEQNQHLREDTGKEKISLVHKCANLEQNQEKAEAEIEDRKKEISTLQAEIKTLKLKLESYNNLEEKLNEKDTVISTIRKELMDEQSARESCQKDLDMKTTELNDLRNKLEEVLNDREVMIALKNENAMLVKAIGNRETFAATSQEKPLSTLKYSGHEHHRDHHHQVDTSPSDTTHTSSESTKTITDLEMIINDKNRTITTLQSDITYLKNMMAESENKLLDVANELEVSKENCEQLSNQLKKIVQQKNEEMSDLKKQITKMSVTENQASQIIKVSAKYQAIILKRIAEIKSHTVLKELTNFGNAANIDNEYRKSLAGNITMEDLENFLETTDKYMKRCSDKQTALLKERDRLLEVNRINESEIINMKKFLTELSVSFKTFSSVKDLYAQKLSRIISLQRTVRREILNLDGQITDAAMCKLERGYTAVMQDLAECTMNVERWVVRCISRTISPEKIKQAFTSEMDRASLSSITFQNTSLEIQLEELEKSFQKILEETARAQKGEGAKDAQSVTVMEVRAEYEDKLNRMKAKMKQLYQEQITIFREKQKEEIALLERELQKTRDKMTESSRAYEDHIRGLTTELWSVGEKFLMKKDEAEWLRRKHSGSLQSLQHVHSSGLVPQEEIHRASDACSLRSLPVQTKKTEGRGLHMSDEEGEVFDNRWLGSLATPRAARSPPPRLSELRWRNSLCPPHLKSSYPAETQFAAQLQEDDIKCLNATGGKQRKEVGITAYKKPGPPTPSKQAGRLSATDSELRESLRPEPEAVLRKTTTPSRLRALFRSSKNDTAEGTPRSRRFSIFRSKN